MSCELQYGEGFITYDARNKYKKYIAKRYLTNNENGNPVCITLGSFATREEALLCLKENAKYSTRELINRKMTLKEVYEHFEKDTDYYCQKTKDAYQHAYQLCHAYHKRRYLDISARDMHQMMKRCSTYNQKKQIKALFKRLDEEAKMLGVPIQAESQFLMNLHCRPGDVKHHHYDSNTFTNEEVACFIAHRNEPDMGMVVVLIETGMRGGELRKMEKKDVHLEEGYMIGGSKTDSGRDRRIPIHPVIEPIIRKWMTLPGEYLLPWNGKKMPYTTFAKHFKKAIAPYVSEYHIPHHTRHTFITRCEVQNVDKNVVAKTVGHKIDHSTYERYFHPSKQQYQNLLTQLWD